MPIPTVRHRAHTLRRWRAFRLQRRKIDLGRRSRRGATRRPGESEPNAGHAEQSRRLGRTADHLPHTPIAKVSATTTILLVGLQLTHSGRFSRPHGKRLEPRIAYHHPLLDAKFGIDPHDQRVVWTDDDLERLIDSYVAAAGSCARRRLSIRRYESLPRIFAARVSERPQPPRPFRRRFGLAARRVLFSIIERMRDRLSRLANRRAAQRVRHAAVQNQSRNRRTARLPASAAVRVRLRRRCERSAGKSI